MSIRTPEKKKEMQRITAQNEELNLNFLDKMVNSKEQMREKMAFSGTDILLPEFLIPNLTDRLLNTIRKMHWETSKICFLK
jgi:hypothetical protein